MSPAYRAEASPGKSGIRHPQEFRSLAGNLLVGDAQSPSQEFKVHFER